MRVMAYLGALVFGLAVWGLWLLHRRRLERSKWFLLAATWAVVTPFLMNTAGWLLAESGRQPWIVQGLMKTADGVSPSISASDVWISIVVFLAVFAALAVADGYLMVHYGRKHLADAEGGPDDGAGGPEDGSAENADELELVY
jgi:cytochrome d ubiquinol oxidase subunit I